MRTLETKIQTALRGKGIDCQSVYRIPDESETKVLLAFGSKNNNRLTTRKVERVLNEMGIGQFKVPVKFQRLSAAFLHLEVAMGTRTEQQMVTSAQ